MFWRQRINSGLLLEQDGLGRVLLIDGSGSLRKALIDAETLLAEDNEWEDYCGLRLRTRVDELEDMNLGIQAFSVYSRGCEPEGVGELDIAGQLWRCPLSYRKITSAPRQHGHHSFCWAFGCWNVWIFEEEDQVTIPANHAQANIRKPTLCKWVRCKLALCKLEQQTKTPATQ